MDDDTSTDRSIARRTLVKAAGVSAVGAAAIAAGPGTAEAAEAARPTSHHVEAAEHANLPGAELVVHVRDPRSGDLDIFLGTRHFPVRDLDLARRIAAAAR